MIVVSNGAVHPRACGEHKKFEGKDTVERGSSPRLRGTLLTCVMQQKVYRFIPAPAGNTPNLAASLSNSPVHPRACGEHDANRSKLPDNAGSSPRLRGTPQPQPG